MARTYAKIKVAIWQDDDDFRSLPVTAQHLYLVLLTSPTLNLAGVADWRPNRLAALSDGWTAKAVRAAANVLTERRYILTDDDTEEVLIRTFIKHDGILVNSKTARGMVTEWGSVYSTPIRATIAEEVRKLAHGVSDSVAPIIESLIAFRPDWASDGASDDQSDQASDWVRDSPATCNQQPATSNRSESVPDSAEFELWWQHYPRKDGKGQAEKAYASARKLADFETLASSAAAFSALCERERTERRFIKLPSTWLNGKCWLDGALAVEPERPRVYVDEAAYPGDPDDVDAYRAWYLAAANGDHR